LFVCESKVDALSKIKEENLKRGCFVLLRNKLATPKAIVRCRNWRKGCGYTAELVDAVDNTVVVAETSHSEDCLSRGEKEQNHPGLSNSLKVIIGDITNVSAQKAVAKVRTSLKESVTEATKMKIRNYVKNQKYKNCVTGGGAANTISDIHLEAVRRSLDAHLSRHRKMLMNLYTYIINHPAKVTACYDVGKEEKQAEKVHNELFDKQIDISWSF